MSIKSVTDNVKKFGARVTGALSAFEGYVRTRSGGVSPYYIIFAAMIPLTVIGEIYAYITSSGAGLINMTMLLASALFCGLLLSRRRLTDDPQAALLLFYALWLIASRVLDGDTYLLSSVERIGYASFASIVCYNIPRLMGASRARDRLLGAMLLFCGGFFMLISLGTLLSPVLGICADTSWGQRIYITDTDHRLHFYTFYPTVIGIYAVLGICSAILGAVRAKRGWLKAAFIVCAFFMLTMLSAADARASTLVIGICAGTAAAFYLYYFLLKKKLASNAWTNTAVRWAACVLICALTVFLTMKYMPAASGSLVKLGNAAHANRSAVSETVSGAPAATLAPAAAGGGNRASFISSARVSGTDAVTNAQSDPYTGQPPEETQIIINNREIDSMTFLTLTGRTDIYKYGIQYLRDDPRLLLAGELYTVGKTYVIPYTEYGIQYYEHFHNSFLSVVFETGLPGLALMLAFTVITVVRSVKVFFNISSSYRRADRLTVLFPAALLVLGMIEPILFSPYASSHLYALDIIFMFFAGYIGAVYKEGMNKNGIGQRD